MLLVHIIITRISGVCSVVIRLLSNFVSVPTGMIPIEQQHQYEYADSLSLPSFKTCLSVRLSTRLSTRLSVSVHLCLFLLCFVTVSSGFIERSGGLFVITYVLPYSRSVLPHTSLVAPPSALCYLTYGLEPGYLSQLRLHKAPA